MVFLMRRWTPPFGSFTLMFAVVGVDGFDLRLRAPLDIVPAVVAGLAADVLVRIVRAGPANPRGGAVDSRAYPDGAVVGAFCWLGGRGGDWGPPEVWSGTIVFGVLLGWAWPRSPSHRVPARSARLQNWGRDLRQRTPPYRRRRLPDPARMAGWAISPRSRRPSRGCWCPAGPSRPTTPWRWWMSIPASGSGRCRPAPGGSVATQRKGRRGGARVPDHRPGTATRGDRGAVPLGLTPDRRRSRTTGLGDHLEVWVCPELVEDRRDVEKPADRLEDCDVLDLLCRRQRDPGTAQLEKAGGKEPNS